MLLIPRHREKSPVLLCEFKASLVYSQNCPRQRNIVSERERENMMAIILYTASWGEMRELYEDSRNYDTMRQI